MCVQVNKINSLSGWNPLFLAGSPSEIFIKNYSHFVYVQS